MVISSRKFENFEMFCPLGAMKLGVQQKKLLHLIQPSQDPTYILFFESGVTGKCRSCTLRFETVLGMNKITPTTSLPPLIPQKLKISKNYFYFNDIFKKFV